MQFDLNRQKQFDFEGFGKAAPVFLELGSEKQKLAKAPPEANCSDLVAAIVIATQLKRAPLGTSTAHAACVKEHRFCFKDW